MKNIVIVDLWTDSNRGDCALQIGLIEMLRVRWPGASIFGVFRFGTNEIVEAEPEIALSTAKLDGYCGGVRRTYYSAPNYDRFSDVAHKIVSLYSFIELVAVVMFFFIGLKFIVPRDRREALTKIHSADLVIWKGKNFRDYRGWNGLNRQLTLLSAGYVATVLNRNVHCVNASIWPAVGSVQRILISQVLSRCRTITVREAVSLAAAKTLDLRADISFAPDLSFYALKKVYASGGKDTASGEAKTVALTITRWGDELAQDRYLKILKLCVERLIAKGATRFVILPQVTRAAENNSVLVEKLTSYFNGCAAQFHVVAGEPTIPELLAYYKQAKLLVGTRMHSCVFAIASGTPFVAIAYDSGPKWDVLSDFLSAGIVFDYGSDPMRVAKAASALFEESEDVARKAFRRFSELADESFTNVSHI